MESMASSNSASSTTATPSQQSSVDKDPLWKHVTKLVKMKERGGNTKIKCNFYNLEFTGSYSRVKAHLLQIKGEGVSVCPRVTADILLQLRREMTDAEERKRQVVIPLPPLSYASSDSAWGGAEMLPKQGSKRRAIDKNSPINKAFNQEVRAQVDGEIARAFYSGGLLFHFSRNPHYIKSYTLAANNNIPSYVPPCYNALRTTLLEKEREHIERLLEPIKTTWKEKGVTIVSDGWTDSQRRPLINFMVVTESGPMFLKAVNCEGEYKDKFYISSLIKKVIMQVGPQKVGGDRFDPLDGAEELEISSLSLDEPEFEVMFLQDD
ncbi:uncharacterized protein LOC124909763 [Impatiens glandulifera]|uniref:uncharacterized protein LOC124909763 n=1 Tax=Impatiens glandulifera TaxID=253017 RepID=UPI001FB0D6A5|nr:uncharacterized protein LOC124909763 [Impatiens glandulifera]